MASRLETNDVSSSNLGIKVEGDIGDFQIIAERSDDEDENNYDTTGRTGSALSNIPPSLIRSSVSSPSYDSVVVKDSKNVQFGNNTYFNGPVTIKQVIQNNSGHENPAYTKTDDESISSQNKQEVPIKSTQKKFKIHGWQKITCSAVCVVIIGGVCTILSVFLSNHNTNDVMTYNEENLYCSTVMGYKYGYNNTTVVSIMILLLLTLSIIYFLPFTPVDYELKGRRSRSESSSINHVTWMNEDEGSWTENQQCSYAESLLIAPDHLRIVSRSDWLAQPTEDKIDKIRQPVPWVIITHTATESCSYQSECVLRVRIIQTFHIESKKWSDIGYNFLVGGDGSAYYGRGWDQIGAHTLGYNKYSIGIAFIGTFNNEAPPSKQLEACKKLIRRGVAMKKIDKNYKLFAHRQLASTLSPGDKLFDILKTWPHFVKEGTNITELIPNY